MCYSGLESDIPPRQSTSPRPSPRQEVPALTLRPPSVGDEFTETRASRSDPLVNATHTIPLKPTISNDSGLSRPSSARSGSASTFLHRERLPITNAIDVWALGVTLYCLLFGKTPFEAANEYLLMQIIPIAEIDYPDMLGRDQLPKSSPEGQECLDLLTRLLEKDPSRRITLDQAKVCTRCSKERALKPSDTPSHCETCPIQVHGCCKTTFTPRALSQSPMTK